MNGSLLPWILFNVFVLGMLALDLGVFHRGSRTVSFRESIVWTLVWVGVALAFNVGLFFLSGPRPALEFLTGYVIEKSLSVDNIFVFLLIFGAFRIAARHQHRVLFWGILGALVMRAVFILAGVKLIESFHFMIYVFGALLIVSGLKMLTSKDREHDPRKNPAVRLFRRLVPVADDDQSGHFWIRREGRWLATPLLVTLVCVEISDLIFAVDSIPAILAVSRDPFIVYTSNVFAILGLRSLYFALAGVLGLFAHLHYGLSAILVFVGGKMLLSEVAPIPVVVSLGVIVTILTVSILTSIRASRKAAESTEGAEPAVVASPAPVLVAVE